MRWLAHIATPACRALVIGRQSYDDSSKGLDIVKRAALVAADEGDPHYSKGG